MRALTLSALLLAGAAGVAAAQGANVPFDGFEHDNTLPVEITSDALDLDQGAGVAIFTGSVRVGQGALRLAAERLEVFYATEDADPAAAEPDAGTAASATGDIERMIATGGVTLTNGAEAAEAERASYVVASGVVEMEGDVLLTQGRNALAGETLRIDLIAGSARMEGRVQTIFTPDQDQDADPAATGAPP
jgi:lipopolysaccharide export system protein LptA